MTATPVTPERMVATPLPESPARGLRVLVYQFFAGGGIGRYSHELVRHLVQEPGIAAELVCLPSYEWSHAGGYPQWPHLFEIGHPRPWCRKARFLAAQVVNPKRLVKRAAESGADIVHLSNINHLTRPLWMPALQQMGVKVVATAHDVRRAKAILHRRHETRQLIEFYRQADALFVHSRPQAEDLHDFAAVDPRRVHVVPHGPYDYGVPTGSRDTLRQRYGLPRDRQVALFFGQLRDEKNLDLLLHAMACPSDAQPPVHLLVSGRGGGQHRSVAEYRRLAERLGVGQRVTWLDRYVPDSEVPDLFELCDWVALPYSRSFTSQSGVLNVAAAHRRPVLLSATPTFRDTLEQCDIGVLCEPDDVAALARGIDVIARRVDRGHPHAFASYERGFGWGENVRRTVEVYRAITAERPRPGVEQR